MIRDRNPVASGRDDAPPPYTETDIYSNCSAPPSHASVGDASHISSTTSGDPILTPPASPVAGSYFETRPASSLAGSGPRMVHNISVRPETLPEHVPYNAGLAARDVTEQDWATFTNYLLPDHAARKNDEIVDRKLRDEARSEDGKSTKSGRSHAEAQLGRIHSSSDAGGTPRMNAAQLREHAVATVQEWNSEFFAPRGITIQLNLIMVQGETGGNMPGAWDESFEERAGSSSQGQDQWRPGWRKHFDKWKVTDNMVRYGDSFVADVNGLKIGSMVMDGRGIRMDGSHPQPAPGFAGPMPGGFGRGCSPGGFGRGHPFGGGWGGPGFGGHHPHHRHEGRRGRSLDNGRHSTYATKHRSHSASSISSASDSDSESDTASICSLDELPDYEDLSDRQLPLYAERLNAWIKTPETVRTRQDVANLRAELKAVKSAGVDPGVDRKALKQNVKTLRSQWKLVRKEQKRVLRERKREKKMRRRGEKRERRERRRDVKRAQREVKKEYRDCKREMKRERRECGGDRREWPSIPAGPPGFPDVPGAPGAPGIPGVSSQPAPHAPYGRPGGAWGGIFGNRGLFGPQGSFGPQVSVPPPHGPPPHGPPPHSFSGFSFPPPGQFSAPPAHDFHETRSAPPGSWPEDKKVDPSAAEEAAAAGGQENGVVEAEQQEEPTIEEKMKELEEELETKISALEGMDDGKERREGEKDVEFLIEKLDGLRMEADEAYARELAGK